jgi:hypothetical protein
MHLEGGPPCRLQNNSIRRVGVPAMSFFWCSVFVGAVGATSKHARWEQGLVLIVKEAKG